MSEETRRLAKINAATLRIDANVNKLTSQIAALQQENADLKARLDATIAERDEYDENVSHLAVKAARLSDANADLKRERDEWCAEYNKTVVSGLILAGQRDEAQARASLLEGWLRALEGMTGFWCPSCHKYDEHRDNCELAKALRKE